jgi:2-polyprenyl-3-methyl-5-hydroxy-6-metoxy-1,4-benzoquinol methylase
MKRNLGTMSIYKQLKEEVGNKKDILDFGCGIGYITSYLKAEGVDINKGALAFAKKHYPRITFSYKTIDSLKKGKKYSVITCVNLIEHLEDDIRNKWFKAVPKILKKNGKMLVVYDDMYHPMQLLSGIIHPGMLLTDPSHVRCWTQKQFRKVLEEKFVIEKEIKGNILALFLPWTNRFATARLYVCRVKPKIKKA